MHQLFIYFLALISFDLKLNALFSIKPNENKQNNIVCYRNVSVRVRAGFGILVSFTSVFIDTRHRFKCLVSCLRMGLSV